MELAPSPEGPSRRRHFFSFLCETGKAFVYISYENGGGKASSKQQRKSLSMKAKANSNGSEKPIPTTEKS
jgi:hypothetical protein